MGSVFELRWTATRLAAVGWCLNANVNGGGVVMCERRLTGNKTPRFVMLTVEWLEDRGVALKPRNEKKKHCGVDIYFHQVKPLGIGFT